MKLDRSDFKMHVLKQAINYLVRSVNGLTPTVQAKTPQSRLIQRAWARLEATAEKEAETVCWNDKNFRNLLETAKKTLIFLCEKDKYYKRWVGLLAYFLQEERAAMKEEFSYEEALDMTVRPLGLTQEEFIKHKAALFELHLCGYLHGLSKIPDSDVCKIREARENKGCVDLPGFEPGTPIRMFFPASEAPHFYMILGDRHEKKG